MTGPVGGVRVGHHAVGGSGVTVVLLPDGTIGSGEVRGGAPATRELALLDPTRTVERVDAVVLAGGSASGLAAADGVAAFLAERGQGVPTAGGPVPIVVGAAIYDLVASGGSRPDAGSGRAAAVVAAAGGPVAPGRVGAGRSATVGKWRGAAYAVPGGFGVASVVVGDARVDVYTVVNALGDVVAPDGSVVAGSRAPEGTEAFPTPSAFEEPSPAGTSTTLVVVATDARLTKLECHLVAQAAHDGLARSLDPVHTRFDGDLAVAVATGRAEAHPDRLRAAAVDVVAESVRACVGGPGPPRAER